MNEDKKKMVTVFLVGFFGMSLAVVILEYTNVWEIFFGVMNEIMSIISMLIEQAINGFFYMIANPGAGMVVLFFYLLGYQTSELS